MAIFKDKSHQGELRAQWLASHIQWLDENRDTVLIGGSLRHAPEDMALGGLWIIEAQSKAAVASLIASDPFFVHGLRDSFEVFHWSKAFADRLTPV